jgi:hypothetical protein
MKLPVSALGALADVGGSPLSASNRRSSESETSAPAASSDM